MEKPLSLMVVVGSRLQRGKMRVRPVGMLVTLAFGSVLAGCTATVGQSSFLPRVAEPGPANVPAPPVGYVLENRTLELPSLGVVHAARLVRPGNRATLIYSGGNRYFLATAGRRMNRLATLSGANIVSYDYPGRGGTSVPLSVDNLIALGPALMTAFRDAGWIGSGPVYSYGFSLGGASASNIARAGGVNGLILESTAPDIKAVAHNMVPGAFRPFVRIAVSDDLKRYDYMGYVAGAGVPILLLAARDDRTVDLKTVNRFAGALKTSGIDMQMALAPGGHGAALGSAEGEAALRAFFARFPD